MGRKIYFSSAPCAAGKTHQLVKRGCDLVKQGRNVLFLQPTKLLIEKTKTEEFGRLAEPPLVKVFHTDTVGQGVAHQLAEYLADPEDRPHVVMATHQALPRIPFLSTARDWPLLIDEVPQVDRELAHIVPSTHPLITDHLRVAQHDGVYGRVMLGGSSEAVNTLVRNPEEDELLEKFRETANVLTTKHWLSFVHLEQFNDLLAAKAKTLTIHSVLMPSILNDFHSVLIAGANFEDTGLFAFWSKLGIRFELDENFAEALRYRKHENGHLATIHFALDRNWSRHLLQKYTEGKSNLERLRDAAKEILEERPFLWQANKAVPDNFFDRGQRLPNNPLGLNDFAKVHDIVFLSALNPSPAHAKFLRSRGLTDEEIERQGYCGVAYQAVMRTSLRDATDLSPKNVIVPDERVAQYLSNMLPGAILKKMNTGIVDEVNKGGRPRVHQNNAEKMRRRREAESEKRSKLLAQVFHPMVVQDEVDQGCSPDDAMRRNETISLYRGSVSRDQHFWASIFSNIKSTTPACYLSCKTAQHFVLAMETVHKRHIAEKAANPLFSPAIFDPNQSSTSKRGRENIVYLQNLVLDFENGELLPEEIPNLFPDLRLIVTNTYGHSSSSPRFRVIILTSKTIGPDAYEALWDAVANKLRDAGYIKSPKGKSSLQKSGLDHSKRTPTSLFYLPAQAENPAESFFRVYSDGNRQLLEPGIWLRNMRLNVPDEPNIVVVHPSACDQAAFEAAIKKWRQAEPGRGNDQFYLLAVELKRLGLTESEIKQTLVQEANFGRSPAERQDQIPSIMNSLRKKRPTE
jgi:hypothetical protein